MSVKLRLILKSQQWLRINSVSKKNVLIGTYLVHCFLSYDMVMPNFPGVRELRNVIIMLVFEGKREIKHHRMEMQWYKGLTLYFHKLTFSSVQFSCSVVADSLRPHELQHTRPPCSSSVVEFTQTHVHRVSDAIQPSHPLSSPSPPAPNPSQHQSLFK